MEKDIIILYGFSIHCWFEEAGDKEEKGGDDNLEHRS